MKMHMLWPKTIKAKLSTLTVLFTLMITIIMVSVSFYLFQSFLQKNLIQTTEFSLQLVMDSIEADMEELIYLSKWCGSNKTISDYLQYNGNNAGYTALSLEAFERTKEEFQNSKIDDYVKRIMISDNENNFIQVIAKAPDLYHSDPKAIKELYFFDQMMKSDKTQWIGIITDPLTKSIPGQVIPIVRPIYSIYRAYVIGWAYITVSSEVLTDHFKNYTIPRDSEVFIHIGDKTYLVAHNQLIETVSAYETISDITNITSNLNTTVQTVRDKAGVKRTMVTYTSGLKGWSLSQTISKEQFSFQKRWYYMLLFIICFFILFLGTLLTLYLNHIINAPIKKIRKKMKQIAKGDFNKDPSIEWENELGEIGKGINSLTLDIVNLMDKRIADEKQKNEMEYQIHLSQINPHFLYNTLNSIKWMATIQNADGIAQMVTSLAKLLKKVSKESNHTTTLREELSTLEDYFTIQKYRYGGSIALTFNIESELLYKCRVLHFSLQPLVENAIFHGIEPKGEAGLIQINARFNGSSDILIEVIDDGIGMTLDKINQTLTGEKESNKSLFKEIGIANVNQRLKYNYGNSYGLSITSEPGEYTKISMLLPALYEEIQ